MTNTKGKPYSVFVKKKVIESKAWQDGHREGSRLCSEAYSNGWSNGCAYMKRLMLATAIPEGYVLDEGQELHTAEGKTIAIGRCSTCGHYLTEANFIKGGCENCDHVKALAEAAESPF